MRIRHLFSFIGSIFLTATVFGGPLKDTYWLQERGELTKYEVARDEVHSRRVPRRNPLRSSAEELRRAVAADSEAELVLYPVGSAHTEENRRLVTKQIAVQLAPAVNPLRLSAAGVNVLKSFGRSRAWWLVESGAGAGSALEAAEALRRIPGVLAVEPQLARQQQRRATIPNDPFFPEQWHLNNTGQDDGEPGIDINVISVWDQFRGAGVTIGIVDDGLDKSHPDLAPNYSASLSFDFNFNDTNPEPPRFSGDDHGTSCAGVAAGRGNNGQGVSGAAFEATLAGLRLIARPNTDADEADAFDFQNQSIQIKSNSWGPSDNGKTLERPGPLARAAMEEAVAAGRGGLGTIIVWAGGNGLDFDDNSNYDGYANSPETIAVGAIGNDGLQPYYSENGADLVVVAPSDGGTLGISTTDRPGFDGYNAGNSSFNFEDADYTNDFGGTSSACPLVSGSVALILQSNPNLGWRDVQEILLSSARMVQPTDPDWVFNSAGFHFNHKFGAGLIDVQAAVSLARIWTNLGERFVATREASFRRLIIPDANPAGLEETFTFTEPLRVEHACVTVDIRHGSRGQLDIELESPNGTISHIAPPRFRDKQNNYRNWRFTSVHHWGESAAGVWRVRIRDTERRAVGTVKSLKVELFGTAHT